MTVDSHFLVRQLLSSRFLLSPRTGTSYFLGFRVKTYRSRHADHKPGHGKRNPFETRNAIAQSQWLDACELLHTTVITQSTLGFASGTAVPVNPFCAPLVGRNSLGWVFG